MNRYYQASNTPSPGKTNSRWGGFIDNPYVFDADFFHVTPEEATVMDPQQRLFLTVAYETMESAGYAGVHSEGRTIGLFVGASHNNYLEHHLHTLGLMDLEEFQSFVSLPEAQRHALRTEWMGRYGVTELHSNTAVDNLLNMIAARTSHTLNLKGPSLTIDTACSSSLVAVHLACESLRRGECEMALAGGVNLLLTPTPYLLFARAGVLSPSGRCKVFDADADGFVPGEGIGTVLLKPLRRALEDRDNVLAVIKGSAVNNDGRSLGVMAPNPDGQRAVMESLYRNHAIHVRDIQYIEAHGTGTAIGDPSEVRALSRAFAELGDRAASCVLGSVKANIGHLLSAAGIASLIKVVLALQHRTMPPSLHLQRPNPLITFEETLFRLLTEAEPWETPIDRPRTAAVSSFGFGGTNCHLVVAEGTARAAHEADARPQHLLAISAHTQEALALRANALAQFLRDRPALPPADVCYTQNTGRAQFEHRLYLRASSTAELAQKLLQPRAVASPSDVRPRVALMFTGQGAQYRNMANALYQALPRFRTTVDECAARFDRYLTRPLLSCIYSPEPDPDLLAQTALTQPAMTTPSGGS
jgi:acyl transferase domain-containing protein